MDRPYAVTADEIGRARASTSIGAEPASAHASAVSWGAIVAGAAAAAALSLILLMLGIGLGLSSVSPWAYDGVSATTFGVSTILWVTFTQLVASAIGGYLAGRLRTRWIAVHTDEVYFRDTAHGFLAWAVASLATAALLTSVIGSIVSGGVQAAGAVGGGAATAAAAVTGGAGAGAIAGSDIAQRAGDSGSMNYYVDSLFRKDTTTTSAAAGGAGTTTAAAESASSVPTAEVGRIFMTNMGAASLPAEDVRHVGQLVAQRTGLAPPEAEKRVSDVYGRMQAKAQEAKAAAKEVADKARKTSAYAALWIFISLLTGAFIASLAATFGGRRRDA